MLGGWAKRRAVRREQASLDRIMMALLQSIRLALASNDYRSVGDMAILLKLVRERRDQLGR